MQDITRKAVRPSDSEEHVKFRSIQADEYTSNNPSVFSKRYTKYIPWPTPFEVAVEMQTMVSCEHLAATSRGWSAFDWAEYCLKQTRNIPEDEVYEQYVLRQWRFARETFGL
jgi:hypothetical protein